LGPWIDPARPKGRNPKEVKSPDKDCLAYGTGALPQTPEFSALKPPAYSNGSNAAGAAREPGVHGCFGISAMTVAIVYPTMPEAQGGKLSEKFLANLVRVETTINDPTAFKSYRASAWDQGGRLAWRTMRKGVADIAR